MAHIQNPTNFRRGTVDWTVLKGTFENEKIRPSDVDGLLEFGDGYVLLMEVKWTGTEIPLYLHKRFLRMSKSTRMKIMLLWGDFGEDDNGIDVGLYQFNTMRIYSNGKAKEDRIVTNDDVKDTLRQFKTWAESRPIEKVR